MHRGVREKLEEILADTGGADTGGAWRAGSLSEKHLRECQECNAEVAAMQEQRALLQSLTAAGEAPEQKAGFYARVMERIEAQGVVSIWQLFFDSRVGRGLAMASMVVAVSLGVYLVSAEQSAVRADSGQAVMRGAQGVLDGSPDANAVLINLVTYREQ